jgi:hypothetical protein
VTIAAAASPGDGVTSDVLELPDRMKPKGDMASGGVEEACLGQCDEAPVRCVATAELELVGLWIRAPHRDADAILRGLKRHS